MRRRAEISRKREKKRTEDKTEPKTEARSAIDGKSADISATFRCSQITLIPVCSHKRIDSPDALPRTFSRLGFVHASAVAALMYPIAPNVRALLLKK